MNKPPLKPRSRNDRTLIETGFRVWRRMMEERPLLVTVSDVQLAAEAVGKRPSAVRQAVRQAHGPEQSRRTHGPEQSRRAALPLSLVTEAYLYVRLIPRDFVPLKTTGWASSISLRELSFSTASLFYIFRLFCQEPTEITVKLWISP